MRRIALLAMVLLLPGCTGFNTFAEHTFGSSNPNRPKADSENMSRVMGQDVAVQPLSPEPGNIWPGPPQPMPTLMSLLPENDMSTPSPGGASGTQPMPAAPAAPSQGVPSGMYQGRGGPSAVTGSRPGYGTITTPGSAKNSIVVPNGNGTSTIIYPDGRVETVPTPR